MTQQELHELLDYNPNTGEFRWKKVAYNKSQKLGQVAGHCSKGMKYWSVKVNRKSYMAHRLAWFYVYGVWPKDQIDHINGNKLDNRISNLRECDTAENHQNIGKPSNNKSGYTGVCWNKRKRKWRAYICVRGQNKHLGWFSNLQDAINARSAAKPLYHTFEPTQR